MHIHPKRQAFTLVEILIVLGIIAAVAAIFVPVALNLTERNQVPKAASMLENAMALAKARAVAERRPNGIRLILSNPALRTTGGNAGFLWFDEIQYIEDPSSFVEHWLWGLADGSQVVQQPFWSTAAPVVGPAAPSPGALPLGIDAVTVATGPFNFAAGSLIVDSNGTTNSAAVPVNRNRCLFGPISIIVGVNQWTANSGTVYRSQRLQYNPAGITPFSIQPGDRIELNGVGEMYTIAAMSVTNVDIAVAPSARIIVPVFVLDRALSANVAVPVNGRPNYNLIRQARPVPAMKPVKLPQDVVIDLTPTRGGVQDLDTTNAFFMSGVSSGINVSPVFGLNPAAVAGEVGPTYVDILFSPSGEIIPTAQRFRTGGNTGSFSVGASGLVALWIHQRGDPNLWANRQATAAQGNADNQALVAVNARTGFIGSYPMTPLAISTDPLNYARTGKARTSADTGQ